MDKYYEKFAATTPFYDSWTVTAGSFWTESGYMYASWRSGAGSIANSKFTVNLDEFNKITCYIPAIYKKYSTSSFFFKMYLIDVETSEVLASASKTYGSYDSGAVNLTIDTSNLSGECYIRINFGEDGIRNYISMCKDF